MPSELAGRGTRLGAALIDNVVVWVPGLYLLWLVRSLFVGGRPLQDLFLFVVLALVCLTMIFIMQLVLLHKKGQTIGKWVCHVRIVKISDGQNGGLGTNFMMRALIPTIIMFIPYVGWAFGLVDTLFIFRDDRRCIHDLIAGTRVVQ